MSPAPMGGERHLKVVELEGLSDFERRWLPTTLRRAASLLELYLPPSEHVFDGPSIRDLRALADEYERVRAGGVFPRRGWVYLDHVYNGPALRITGHEWVAIRAETIAGAFAVLYRDERCAIIDNGEEPRGRWLVTMLDRLVKP